MIEKCDDVNQTNANGDSALHLAAKFGHLNCIEVLILAKVNVQLKNKQNKTALDLASEFRHIACKTVLIQVGAETSEQEQELD